MAAADRHYVRRPPETGVASAARRSALPSKVILREGEPVQVALLRLMKQTENYFGRPSHKRRFGYYEKPSQLERKRTKWCRKVARQGSFMPMRINHQLMVQPLEALWRRTGSSNSLMR